MRDSLAPLLDDLIGDERNVLLTLARMLVTLETGEILSKDQAARRILPSLRDPDRSVLALATAGYLGECEDDWSRKAEQTRKTALDLAVRIRASGCP
jgi:streptomycin 3"-adenylyltransferase